MNDDPVSGAAASAHTVAAVRRSAQAPKPTLRLLGVSFRGVELEIRYPDGHVRLASVRVGAGNAWRRAVRFPHLASDRGESTEDPWLDALIRERAAEELIRLAAAVEANKERRAA
jgi:hypothetical protein